MFKADGTRRDFPVSKPRFVIGRTNGCDLRVPLASVSRQHCELRIEGNKIHLRDLGSSNGTHHNSVRVQEVTLKAGDEIAIGSVVFTVVMDGQPRHIEPVRTTTPGAGGIGAGDPKAAAEPLGLLDGTAAPAPTPPPKPAKPAAKASDKPQELPVRDDDEIPLEIEPEAQSPTVDLDDPIAALEALAKSEKANTPDSSDSGEIPLLADDDDEPPKSKTPPPKPKGR